MRSYIFTIPLAALAAASHDKRQEMSILPEGTVVTSGGTVISKPPPLGTFTDSPSTPVETTPTVSTPSGTLSPPTSTVVSETSASVTQTPGGPFPTTGNGTVVTSTKSVGGGGGGDGDSSETGSQTGGASTSPSDGPAAMATPFVGAAGLFAAAGFAAAL